MKLEWTPLSAWGLGISVSCQVSNAIMKIMDPESSINNTNSADEKERKWQQDRQRELEKRKERRIGGDGNTEKKKE